MSKEEAEKLIEMVKSAHEQDFDLYISACKCLGIIAYEAPMDRVACREIGKAD